MTPAATYAIISIGSGILTAFMCGLEGKRDPIEGVCYGMAMVLFWPLMLTGWAIYCAFRIGRRICDHG